MNEKIYHVITYSFYDGHIIEILNFRNLGNAIKVGKHIIENSYYLGQLGVGCSLEEYYEEWEKNHWIKNVVELAESEFED